jgi:hypothetical protein
MAKYESLSTFRYDIHAPILRGCIHGIKNTQCHRDVYAIARYYISSRLLPSLIVIFAAPIPSISYLPRRARPAENKKKMRCACAAGQPVLRQPKSPASQLS